jgi:hypothetical protein
MSCIKVVNKSNIESKTPSIVTLTCDSKYVMTVIKTLHAAKESGTHHWSHDGAAVRTIWAPASGTWHLHCCTQQHCLSCYVPLEHSWRTKLSCPAVPLMHPLGDELWTRVAVGTALSFLFATNRHTFHSLAGNLFHIGRWAVIATGSTANRAEPCLHIYGVSYDKCLPRRRHHSRLLPHLATPREDGRRRRREHHPRLCLSSQSQKHRTSYAIIIKYPARRITVSTSNSIIWLNFFAPTA